MNDWSLQQVEQRELHHLDHLLTSSRIEGRPLMGDQQSWETSESENKMYNT